MAPPAASAEPAWETFVHGDEAWTRYPNSQGVAVSVNGPRRVLLSCCKCGRTDIIHIKSRRGTAVEKHIRGLGWAPALADGYIDEYAVCPKCLAEYYRIAAEDKLKSLTKAVMNELLACSIGMESRFTSGSYHDFIKVGCVRCKEVTEYPYKPGKPTEFVLATLKRKGWLINGKHMACPTCMKSEREEKEMSRIKSDAEAAALVSKITQVSEADASSRVSSAVSGADPAAKKRIRDFLDGHFDEDRGQYLDGYTDEKSGADLGIPWAWVRDYREFAYGPLKVDVEAEKLAKDIAAAGDKIEQDIQAIEEKFLLTVDALRKKVQDQIASLTSRLRVKCGV